MPPAASRRRRKIPDVEGPEPPYAQVMAPTRMKLRVRRRDNAASGGGDGERSREGARSSGRRRNAAKAAAADSPPPTGAAVAAATEEASPDSKCPICLDRFTNLAFLDVCLHRFCFRCIQEWSRSKAECPLCKQPFASILHSGRHGNGLQEYTLRPPPPAGSVAATVAMVAAMASAARSDHHMRLMLRRHRVAGDATATAGRRRRRDRGGADGGGGTTGGVWEWYLDSPPLPPPPDHAHMAAEDGEEPRLHGVAAAGERGVIFEGLSGLGGAVAPAAASDRAARRLMSRLAARRRLQREGGALRRLRERETVAFRRGLYRCGVRVRGGAAAGSPPTSQRDITADGFRRNPAHLDRLRPWLRRELTVLYGAHGALVDVVQRIITARLARHGLEDTPAVEEELRPFLLARTEHFLHELVSFARSPLSLDSYDQLAVYEPLAAADADAPGASSDGSSVIAISEGEEEAGPRPAAAGGGLSRAGWDDETPGPSYSVPPDFSPAPLEPANEDGGGGGGGRRRSV